MNSFHRYWISGAELIRHPRVLGAVADLIGPDVRYHSCKAFLKPPFEGTAKEWHQDLNAYVEKDVLEQMWALGPALDYRDTPMVAAQVYLDDSTEQNGCLRFVPGSHKGGLINEKAQPDRVREDFYSPERVVRAEAGAGSLCIFHCITLHYSGPNRSATPRRAPIVQYFAPARYNPRPIYPDPFGERLMPMAGR